jgi:hypothetical protein
MKRKFGPPEARPETTEHIAAFIRKLRDRPELKNTTRHELLTIYHLTAHEAKIVMALLRCYDSIFPKQESRSVNDDNLNILLKIHQETEKRLEKKDDETERLRAESKQWESRYWGLLNKTKKAEQENQYSHFGPIRAGLTSRDGMINGKPIVSDELPQGDLPF